MEVIFAAGTYRMTAPLELRPEDSGTAAFPITWKAATDADGRSQRRQADHRHVDQRRRRIWHTDLTGVGLGANQWNFRQLFVNGSRATSARYPNATLANPFLYATGGRHPTA